MGAHRNIGLHSNGHVTNQYEMLEDIVRAGYAKWDGSILVKADRISIRTADYVDYIFAKKALSGRVSKPIEWDKVL